MAANPSRRDLLKVGLAAIPVGNFSFSQPTANAQDPAPQAVVPDVMCCTPGCAATKAVSSHTLFRRERIGHHDYQRS
jgi:hypothetical protein